MQRASYDDRDYSFGQTILTLRAAIGLTQAGLAEYLGVSRRAVGAWEAGSKYPKATHLKQFIALAIEQRAFPAVREVEEIRGLWQAAHQKVLLDEAWLSEQLAPQAAAESAGVAEPVTLPAARDEQPAQS